MCGYKKTSEQHFCHSDVFPVTPPASLIIYLLPYQRKPNDFRGLLVRVVRLERTVSWSQTRRDTNFAIPGYSFFCHDTTANGKNKVFSVCSHLCGQSCFYAAFGNRGKSSKRRCHKALRRFTLPCPGYGHGTPKPGAIPTSLYPDIE